MRRITSTVDACARSAMNRSMAGGMPHSVTVTPSIAALFTRPLRCLPRHSSCRVVHRSVTASELAVHGLAPAEVIDFSVDTNPLGPAPVVLRAILETDCSRYPGDDEGPLRHKLAERCGVRDDQVVLGAEPVCIGDTVAAPAYRALFVCNPNNPTGHYRGPDMIGGLLVDRPERLVILDEAYAPFVEDRWSSEALLDHGNLVVLRSMTKEQGLAGLRLGYLLAAPEVARAIEAVRPPWSVNSGALRAGLAVLEPEADAHVLRAR
jgi:histidinol-phosphate/aromatic aminotransferase/cobyric acid decarboxylase-like protein